MTGASDGKPPSKDPKAEKPGQTAAERDWEKAEAEAKRQNAEPQQPASGVGIRDPYPTPEAAVGQVEGKVTVVNTVETVNPGLRAQGYTKTWYVVDKNGVQWTVAHNPRTGSSPPRTIRARTAERSPSRAHASAWCARDAGHGRPGAGPERERRRVPSGRTPRSPPRSARRVAPEHGRRRRAGLTRGEPRHAATPTWSMPPRRRRAPAGC